MSPPADAHPLPMAAPDARPLLEVRNLKTYFPVTSGLMATVSGWVKAVDDVSFDVAPRETVGLVGESGCGKTTAGRSILRLIEPTAGEVRFEGVDVARLGGRKLKELRKKMQIIFQDPYSSLNPRKTVLEIVGEAMRVHGIAESHDVETRVADLIEKVGLSRTTINRYPHEFSGGQRQRVGIARAIALDPTFIVCDEAVSALDVSIQAQVINLLIRLRNEMGLAYLFIAHDLSVVRHISHRVVVMYLGRIVEVARTADLFANPIHPYTQALLSAIPVANPRHQRNRTILEGDVPSPLNPPSGCPFHPRCPVAEPRCSKEIPQLFDAGEGHQHACLVKA